MQNTKKYRLPACWHNAIQNKIDLSSFSNGKMRVSECFLESLPQTHGDASSPTPFLTWNDPAYPVFLKKQSNPPPVLFYKGNISLLQERIVALVGTRRCSENGKILTSQLATMINQGNVCTISGLAYGIDEIAHKASLSKTIGVMPCGFSAKIGSQITELGAQIVDQKGLLLSEFLPWQPPRKWRFIHRNRLIAWLADEIVIIEAAEHSGALYTAKFALQAAQSLWAVPYSPMQYTGTGCLNLIQAGVQPLCSLKQFALHLDIPYTENEIFSISEFAQHMNVRETVALRMLAKEILNGRLKSLSHGYYQWI